MIVPPRGSWRSSLLVVALLAASTVALASCAPSGSAPFPVGADATDPTLTTGRVVWVANCQRCHGPKGQGGAGERIAGRMTDLYPDPVDQEQVVHNGKGGGMPAFRALLTDAEISAVVAYTRRVL